MGKRLPVQKEVAQNKKKQNSNEKNSAKKKGPKFIPKHFYFGKNLLAPYTNEDGCPLYLSKGKDEKQMLKLKNIRKSRTSQNEELCRRLGMGLSLDAASLNHGAKALKKHCAGESLAELKAALEKTGLLQSLAFFAGEEGAALLEALGTLDVGKTRKPSKKQVKLAVGQLLKFATTDAKTKQKHLARLVSFTAKMYHFGTTLLKFLALADDPAEWAAKFEGPQSKAVAAWCKKPADAERQEEAFISELMNKVENNEKAGKKRKATDSSSDDEEGEAGGSEEEEDAGSQSEASSSSASGSAEAADADNSSDSSSSEEDKKKKKKKDKKSKDEKEKKPAKEKKEPKEKKELKAKKEPKEKKKDKKDPKEKKTPKAEEEPKVSREDQKTAAFTTWPQGDVQLLNNDIANMKQEIGPLPTGKVKKEGVLDLLARVPEQILDFAPSLVADAAEARAHEEDMLPNTLAKKVLVKLAVVTSEAEAWWEEQRGGATARGSGN